MILDKRITIKGEFMKNLDKYIGVTLISTILLLSSACNKKTSKTEQYVSDESSIIEEVSKTIGSNLDANESSSSNSMNKISEKSMVILDSNTECSQMAFLAVCSVDPIDGLGVKNAQFNSCQIEKLRNFQTVELNGSVQLKYSSSTCELESVGESVTRTYNMQYSTAYNASVTITSEDTNAIDPVTGEVISIGGGAQLTHESSGWLLNILGKNVTVKNSNGVLISDLSIRTANPIVGHGYRYDGTRVVDSGSVEVYHKLAKFKSSLSVHNLKYNTQCCHPVSGTIDLNYQSAEKSWTGVLNISGCGTAELTKSGESTSQSISFNTCE